jgi:hypothetical protein
MVKFIGRIIEKKKKNDGRKGKNILNNIEKKIAKIKENMINNIVNAINAIV